MLATRDLLFPRIQLLNRSLTPKTPTTTAFSFQWDIRWRKIDWNFCQLDIYDNFDENSFDKSGLLSILWPFQVRIPDQGDSHPSKFPQLGNNWPIICCGIVTESVLFFSFSWPTLCWLELPLPVPVPEKVQVALGKIKVRKTLQMLKIYHCG